MANQRRENQQLIGFWADSEFASQVDAARGLQQRSQFLRDAVADYLRRRGYAVRPEKTVAPDRTSKSAGTRESHPAAGSVDTVANQILDRQHARRRKRSGPPAPGAPIP